MPTCRRFHRFLQALPTLFVIGVATIEAGVSPVRAAEKSEGGKGVEVREKVVTRIYDIGDIVYDKRNYPYYSAIVPPTLLGTGASANSGGGKESSGGGGGGSLFSGEGMVEKADHGAASRAERVTDVLRLIEEEVAPDSWRDNGGVTGSIKALGIRLIVTNTEPVHARISELLEAVKADSDTTRVITLSVRWAMLTPEQVSGLLKKDGHGKASNQIDPDALAKLPPDAFVYRGDLRCLNGQTVHIASGSGRSALLKTNAQVGQTAVGSDPEIELLHAGLAVQATPQVDAEGKTALVDLHSVYSDRRPDGTPIEVTHIVAGGKDQEAAKGVSKIDRLEVLTQEFQTTLRLPIGRPSLAGGMTLEPIDNGDHRLLYMIVEVSVEKPATP